MKLNLDSKDIELYKAYFKKEIFNPRILNYLILHNLMMNILVIGYSMENFVLMTITSRTLYLSLLKNRLKITMAMYCCI